MDFLLDPNIAYLFLVGGVLLATLSLSAPGTGFFEVGAFFSIVLGVYVIHRMEVTPVWWALILLVSSVVPFVYAIQKPKRELFLGLSILLLVSGSVFIFPRTNGQPGVNPIVAIVASSLVAGFLWIAVTKYIQVAHSRPSHDIDGLVGQIGEAKTRIHDEGSVQVSGELWSARSEKAIPAGSSIRVLRREGFILIVEKNS